MRIDYPNCTHCKHISLNLQQFLITEMILVAAGYQGNII
jgi:hypothetical protein